MKFAKIAALVGLTLLAGCNFNVLRDTSAPSFVKTCPTGQETRVLADYQQQVQPGSDPAGSEGPNCIDEAFQILQARAYPQPDPRQLARCSVDALCSEYTRQTGRQVPSAHREAWIWTAIRNRTFQQVLDELAALTPAAGDDEALIAAGLEGLLRGAGPRSAQLYSPAVASALASSRGQNDGQPGAVGLAVDNWPEIDVLPLGPAYQAGLRDGDVITAVQGRDVSAADSRQAVDRLLAGPVGSTLQINARRGDRRLGVTVRRGSQASLAVRAAVPADGVCYIRIPSFAGPGVGEKVADLVDRAGQAGIRRFLLDLRGNTGGRLEEANAVGDLFLDRRTLQTFSFRVGRRIVFVSRPGRIEADVIVLTNRATASAAEMLAMALRDNGAARIVGEETFGALFARETRTLSNGYAICYRAELTILSPRGDDYSVTGIDPDVAVQDRCQGPADAIYDRAVDLAIRGGQQPVAAATRR